jgi:hypothetical protein
LSSQHYHVFPDVFANDTITGTLIFFPYINLFSIAIPMLSKTNAGSYLQFLIAQIIGIPSFATSSYRCTKERELKAFFIITNQSKHPPA